MSSEVNERQSIGRLASPLLMQKREASAALARIYHFIGEGSVSSSSHSKRGETCRDIHTNGNRAEVQEAYRRHIPQVKEHGPSIKKLDITYNYEQLKQPKESRRTEMKMQEFKAESEDFALRELNRPKQNRKTERELIKELVLKLLKMWKNFLKGLATLKLREPKNYELMIFLVTNCGKASPR